MKTRLMMFVAVIALFVFNAVSYTSLTLPTNSLF